MNPRLSAWWGLAVCAVVAGCATPPTAEAPRTVAPTVQPASTSITDALEARHRERAQAAMRERNWADALVQWDMLSLLNPNAQEYRDGIAQARNHIRESASAFTRAAEQARLQGNLDQATLLYLRVLNVDRENTAAAQALRDIDAERTRRSFTNRPPRVVM